jgi:hypothetical protein
VSRLEKPPKNRRKFKVFVLSGVWSLTSKKSPSTPSA